MLAHEAADWQDETARAWAVALTPLAETITDLMLAWLPKATYPTRDGMHSNSAFGLARSLPWARHLARQGNPRLLDAIRETALRWYQHDENYPANWEPSGADFLSPALTEAELICELLDEERFLAWLDTFLPGLAEANPPSLFQPATVTDTSDGQIAHLHGLNLYRAFVMQRLSHALPAGDQRVTILRRSASQHAAASLPVVSGGDYMVEHWLACYAVLFLTADA